MLITNIIKLLSIFIDYILSQFSLNELGEKISEIDPLGV